MHISQMRLFVSKIVKHTVKSTWQRHKGTNDGRLPFYPKFRNFLNGTKGTEISWEKFQKSEIVEFPKSEPFKQKFRDESQMERKFPGRNFRKLEEYLTRLCTLSKIMQLVLLAAITVSWTSRAGMTAMRIRLKKTL